MLSMPRIVRPDPLRSAKQRFGSPVGLTTHRSIKRNKELADTFDSFVLSSSPTRFAPLALEIQSTPVQKCPHDCVDLRHAEFF